MAENQTATEDSHRHSRGSTTSTQKGQSVSSGTGSMSSTVSSKPHSLKHGVSLGHSPKAASMISPESKHHHHHHHHHHHSHSHHSTPHVIHRTTSESLRLAGTEVNAATGTTSTAASSPSTNSSSSGTTNTNCNSTTPQLHLSAPGMRKPKTSSFQITSVTVGNKLSADNGEDSADDLDESHTDDNSRITDLENETPSVSEDTFSKEDVFFSSNALGTAPVIPTSSQYGLVIVDPDLGGVGGGSGQTLSNVHVSVTDAGINIVGPNGGKLTDGDQKELHHRNERFKVVKIESTEPFKRGRWMCMDYLDHTTLQQAQSPSAETGSPPTTGTGNVTTNDSGVNVSENHIDSGGDPPDIAVQPNLHAQSQSPGQTLQNPVTVSAASEQTSLSQPTTNPTGPLPTGVQAQTMGHVPNPAPAIGLQQQQPQNPTAQSLPPAQLQQAISAQAPPQPPSSTTQPAPEYQNSTSSSNLQGQSQPANFYLTNLQAQASAPASHPHGATLPTNIQMQNGVPTNLPCPAQPAPPQPQNPQQPVSQSQNISSVNAPMAVSSSVQPSDPVSVASSVDQPIVQQPVAQQPPQQQPENVVQQGQTLTTQSAPQTQVSSEIFIPQPAAQSFTAPPVTAAAMPTVSSTTSTSQDVPVDGPASMPSVPTQPSNVISPAGSGTPASIVPPVSVPDTVSQQSQQPQPPLPAAQAIPPSVIQETSANLSQPSTISDSALIAAAIQVQQQVTAPPTTLQTQQSVVSGSDENAQQPALDTDSESVSSLALALSNNKKSVKKHCTSAASAHPSYTSSDRPFSLNSEGSDVVQHPKASSQQSKVYTNLALGECIQQLMGVSRGTSLKHELEPSVKDRSVEDAQGIPIPKSHRPDNPNFTSESIIPEKFSSSFYCGSVPLAQMPDQVACSYEYPSASMSNLRAIGKTNSIPAGCFTYKADSEHGIGRSNITASGPSSHRRFGSIGGCTNNSASGTSAVAIDNKIEQAMDLVKSHLMIAVREEVEVLKEKIAELMDRINQLELENTILKANVSQETLSQLSQSIQTASTKTPQNTNTSNGPVS